MQHNKPNLGLQYNASFQKYLVNDIGLSDLEAIRLILSGDSVVDWNRANFRTMIEVDRFLLLHLIDLNIPADRKRVYYLHQKAMEYLEEHLKIRFPSDLRKPKDIREIFLKASYNKGFNRRKNPLLCYFEINACYSSSRRCRTSVSDSFGRGCDLRRG